VTSGTTFASREIGFCDFLAAELKRAVSLPFMKIAMA
jgi:hypothetical protein